MEWNFGQLSIVNQKSSISLCHGQIYDYPCADRNVGLSAHASMMVRHNLPHNRQPEAGSFFSRRKVGQEQAILILLGETASRITDFNADGTLLQITAGAQL